MTNEEKIETLQKQLDMTNANYNILNRKYIEANIKIRHFLDGIEMIKHREYSDISQLVIENSVLKKKNRECGEKIKELEEIVKNNNQKLSDKYFAEINRLDEEYNADLDVRLKEIEKLKQSQNQKAIEVLEKLKEYYSNNPDWDWLINTCELEEYINIQIAELRG